MVMDGTVVGSHRRHLGRDKVIYDPWHYLAVLEKKPGALRDGAPFKQWALPEAMAEKSEESWKIALVATASLSSSCLW